MGLRGLYPFPYGRYRKLIFLASMTGVLDPLSSEFRNIFACTLYTQQDTAFEM